MMLPVLVRLYGWPPVLRLAAVEPPGVRMSQGVVARAAYGDAAESGVVGKSDMRQCVFLIDARLLTMAPLPPTPVPCTVIGSVWRSMALISERAAAVDGGADGVVSAQSAFEPAMRVPPEIEHRAIVADAAGHKQRAVLDSGLAGVVVDSGKRQSAGSRFVSPVPPLILPVPEKVKSWVELTVTSRATR